MEESFENYINKLRKILTNTKSELYYINDLLDRLGMSCLYYTKDIEIIDEETLPNYIDELISRMDFSNILTDDSAVYTEKVVKEILKQAKNRHLNMDAINNRIIFLTLRHEYIKRLLKKVCEEFGHDYKKIETRDVYIGYDEGIPSYNSMSFYKCLDCGEEVDTYSFTTVQPRRKVKSKEFKHHIENSLEFNIDDYDFSKIREVEINGAYHDYDLKVDICKAKKLKPQATFMFHGKRMKRII